MANFVGRRGVQYDVTDGCIKASLAVGAYSRVDIASPCGLAGVQRIIGNVDDPMSFFSIDRLDAGLLWLHAGFVEYRLASRLPAGARATRFTLHAEICSDAPGYRLHHPSDITLWINDIEVVTWLSPGDFGGRRGHVTPAWWSIEDTQFGELKRIVVDDANCTVDGSPTSRVRINELHIGQEFSIRIGIKRDAANTGGLNLFGATYGDHPCDPTLVLDYEAPPITPMGTRSKDA